MLMTCIIRNVRFSVSWGLLVPFFTQFNLFTGAYSQVYHGLCWSTLIICGALLCLTGILIPLCESGTCTLREAIIIGSILTKCSIPVLYSR